MKQIFSKPEKCMACRSCEIACAIRHSKSKNLLGAVMEAPGPRKRLFVEPGDAGPVPVLCRHCEEAPCVNACISGCLYKDEQQFVRRKKERCIGCWSCIMACPFGVITRDKEKRIAVKCDRCHELDVPACVTACPTRALVLIEADDLSREKRQSLVLNQAKP